VAHAAALVGATLSLVGCATARPRPHDARADAAALAAADARVLDGCYDCLLEARGTYARLADGPLADSAAPRLFEVDVLLAIREKELALDWRTSVARARTIAPRLPAALAPERVLRMVEAVLPDPDGTPLQAMADHRRRNLPMLAAMDGEVAWLAGSGYTPAAREYVALALECSNGRRPAARRGARGTLRAPTASDPPLVAYRVSFCARVDTAALRRLQEAVPAFVEASYYLAQSSTARAPETGGDEARAHFEAAYARFPKAPGLTFAYGWLETVVGDCEAAVPRYAESVGQEPAHERAWRQMTICLSALHQDSATVEAATRLIALRSAHSDDGYYWRALSRLRLAELATARADIDTAKARSRAANVLTLAGVIEHDQGDLPIAERDLREALAAPSGPANCTAASYLARVLTRVERWRESAGSFVTAMGCFDQKVAQLRARLEELTATPPATPAIAEARARRVARLVADSIEHRRSYHTSAYNAASMHARVAEFARAGELLEIAARDPERAEVVAKLREAMAKVRTASRAASSAASRTSAAPR
jgi:tetratricopeptide (TPR) repeat protein